MTRQKPGRRESPREDFRQKHLHLMGPCQVIVATGRILVLDDDPILPGPAYVRATVYDGGKQVGDWTGNSAAVEAFAAGRKAYRTVYHPDYIVHCTCTPRPDGGVRLTRGGKNDPSFRRPQRADLTAAEWQALIECAKAAAWQGREYERERARQDAARAAATPQETPR